MIRNLSRWADSRDMFIVWPSLHLPWNSCGLAGMRFRASTLQKIDMEPNKTSFRQDSAKRTVVYTRTLFPFHVCVSINSLPTSNIVQGVVNQGHVLRVVQHLILFMSWQGIPRIHATLSQPSSTGRSILTIPLLGRCNVKISLAEVGADSVV